MRWDELQKPCGWVDRVGGNCKGRKCRVSLGDEVASTVLDWAVLTHKKRLRGEANYRPNFLDIFVSFFFFPPLFFMAAPIWSVALKEKEQLHGNRLNCPAFATVIATVEPPWGWWWAGPCWLQAATHLWRRAVFKLGKWLQNTHACSFVLNVCPCTDLQ